MVFNLKRKFDTFVEENDEYWGNNPNKGIRWAYDTLSGTLHSVQDEIDTGAQAVEDIRGIAQHVTPHKKRKRSNQNPTSTMPVKHRRITPIHRLRKVERQCAMMKPEMKTYQQDVDISLAAGGFYVTSLTAGIILGVGSSNRIGSEIKIHAVEVRGYNGNGANLTMHVVRPNDDDSPTASDFSGGDKPSSFYDHNRGWELMYIPTSSLDNRTLINRRYRFKRPMTVKQFSNFTRNELYLCIKNGSTGTNGDIDVVCRIWYTE